MPRYLCHQEKAQNMAFASSLSDEDSIDDVVVGVTYFSEGYECDGCEYESPPKLVISGAKYFESYIEDAGGIALTKTLPPADSGVTLANYSSGNDYEFVLDGNNTEPIEAFKGVLKGVDVLIDISFFPAGEEVAGDSVLNKVLSSYGLINGTDGTDGWNETLGDEYPFVKNQLLWRVDRRMSGLADGGWDWFESRYPRADVLLEDMIYAIHPEYKTEFLNDPSHELTWMRNLFDEGNNDQVFLTSEMCDDESVSVLQLVADECSVIRS